jgi:hypothetical protein
VPGDRRFLAFARWRLGHLFPYLPKQPGYNKRVRALAPQIVRLLNIIAFESPSFGDALWLLDGTPVPCGASRETARRSERVRSLRDPAPKRGVSNVATTAGVRRARQRRA